MSDTLAQPLPINRQYLKFELRERLLLGLVATLLVLATTLYLYNPPDSITVKLNGSGQTLETTESSSSDSGLAIVVYVSAAVLLFVAVNGLRIARLSAGTGGVGVETAETLSNVMENVTDEKKIEGIPDSDKETITPEDVVREFAKIRESPRWGNYVRDNSLRIRELLIYNGVATKGQLTDLVSNDGVLNTLRSVYMEVLQRDPNTPIDPDAVAVWGSNLFHLGLTKDVVRALKDRLRNFKEYRDLHPEEQ